MENQPIPSAGSNTPLDDDLVMNLVELALAQPDTEREPYLRNACGDNPALFDQTWHYVNWERRMNGFLLQPLYSLNATENPFEAGELVMDRFRIVREIARGGMGIVYEAFDQKLERRIAIKCAKAGFRKRLPPEVRHASEISHPNVCKIFEIHTASTQQGDIDFLTMEYLEGETLAERLKGKTRLTPEEARAIAIQLCDGLAEAHRNHVIHGDLKSGNVILARSTDGSIRAVITDFGLARRPQASQQTLASAAQGGTPDYMAPELWRGQKASVSSDIYALGVLLYELASGRRPFALRESEPTMTASKVSWPERLNGKPPAVDPSWDRILSRCLDPDPAKRFSSAADVGQALQPRSKRRLVTSIAAALALAALSGVLAYRNATGPQQTFRLAVLPFEGDAGVITQSVAQDAATQVARLKGTSKIELRNVSFEEAQRKHVLTPETARTALDATHTLHGRVDRKDGNLVVDAFLTDVRSGERTEWKATYKPAQVRMAGFAMAGFLTQTLHLMPLATAAPVGVAAQEDYAKGIPLLAFDSKAETALALLQRAAEADPDSALTQAGLAEAQWKMFLVTKDQKWRELAAESLRLAEGINPDLAAVHNMAGLQKAYIGFYEQAVAEYQRALELDPGPLNLNHSDTYRRLASVYALNNQLDQSVTAYQKAVAANPLDHRNHLGLGGVYYRQADYTQALPYIRKTVELAPTEASAHYFVAATYMEMGRFEDAVRELRESIALQPTANAIHSVGGALMYEGHDAEALSYFAQSLQLNPRMYNAYLYMGIAYRRLGRHAESRAALQRGLDLAEMEMARNPRSGYVRSFLAYFAASLGNRNRAESEAAQALQLSPQDMDARWTTILTYEALGQRDATLSVLGTSPAGLLHEVSRWPDLADLHEDRRFSQLLASRPIR